MVLKTSILSKTVMGSEVRISKIALQFFLPVFFQKFFLLFRGEKAKKIINQNKKTGTPNN